MDPRFASGGKTMMSNTAFKNLTLSFLPALLVLISFNSTLYASTVVVPAPFESAEGSSSQFSSLTSDPRTLQFVYSSSQLGGLTAGSVITGLAFRLDITSPTGPSSPLSWASYDIQLSPSLNSPGSLSLNFLSNIGPGAVNVRSGALTLAPNSFPGGAAPNAFGPTIVFTSAYTYTGGDLLVTISHTGNGISPLSVDAAPNTAGLYQGVGASTYNATTATSTLVSNVPILQFTVSSVPEPSTWMLLIASLPCLGLLALRKTAASH
jgi:hypothetical protein